ncbi:MAG: hypothetical protein HOC24_02675 [Deltaproteobacteria bacterium]|jgi:hypothetical protein|nr:hypothetical protein [Deltaproteobacteria bacterium]
MEIKSERPKGLKVSASGLMENDTESPLPNPKSTGNLEIIRFAKSEILRTTAVVKEWISNSN